MSKEQEKPWQCTGASYEKKLNGRETIIETCDGESWSVTVRDHLCGGKWRLIIEVIGLKDQSVAKSVASDLYTLADTIRLGDISK